MRSRPGPAARRTVLPVSRRPGLPLSRRRGLAAARARGLPALALGVLAAAGLGLDAFVHADLAHTYAEVTGAISEGTLFWIETVLASIAALSVLLIRRLPAYALAFLVSASALALMLVSRYADVGPIGPIPDLYDPVWYPEKILAAVGEGVAAAAGLGGIAVSAIGRRQKPTS